MAEAARGSQLCRRQTVRRSAALSRFTCKHTESLCGSAWSSYSSNQKENPQDFIQNNGNLFKNMNTFLRNGNHHIKKKGFIHLLRKNGDDFHI